MSLPFFPMYPDDFEADTPHLTLVEDGAYNRLLRLCWRSPDCMVPADEAWLMRQLRARTEDEKAAVRAVIEEFFTEEKGRIFSDRLRKEWIAAREAYERRANAGSKGGKSKSLKTNNSRRSNAKAMLKQPEPEPEPHNTNADALDCQPRNAASEVGISAKIPPIKRAPKRGVSLPHDWVPSEKNMSDARDRNFTEVEISHEADQFRDHHVARGTIFKDWDAAWRTWIRNARKYAPRGMADQKHAFRSGRGSSLASIAARRRLEGNA